MKQILLALMCIVPFSFVAQDITQGVVGHWLMDDEEEVIDQSSSALDAVYGSYILTEDRFGEEDEAHYFDGISDYVVFEDALDDITTVEDATFSISLWHRTDEVLPALSPLICKYAHTGCGDPHRQWALLIAAGEGIRFYYASTPDNLNYRGISTLEAVAQEPSTWYHIVATYDGSIDSNDGQDRVQIYVDNVLQSDTMFPTGIVGELGATINDADAPIALMAYVDVDGDQCGDFNAPGALDDVRIYNRLISSEEVGLLFVEGLVGVEENELSASLSLYPSIVSDGTLSLNSLRAITRARIDVLSQTGQIIISEHAISFQGDHAIDVGVLKAGSYLMRLSTADGTVATKRFIVQ